MSFEPATFAAQTSLGEKAIPPEPALGASWEEGQDEVLRDLALASQRGERYDPHTDRSWKITSRIQQSSSYQRDAPPQWEEAS
ncbi:hypothetical protein Tco_1558498 [Tanacetum coccineum]